MVEGSNFVWAQAMLAKLHSSVSRVAEMGVFTIDASERHRVYVGSEVPVPRSHRTQSDLSIDKVASLQLR
jgi:hypothetical protein